MKIERTQNATRNIIFGMANRIYQIMVPFVLRTLMIHTLGIKYLGLNSLFASVLQVLNLAELGVGNALVYSMYKPIAEDDTNKICALMRLYKIYYKVIGIVVLVIGLCLLPFIPNLVSGDVPSDINIYVLYVLNLSATVLSYWLFAYKNSLLVAHQRIDVSSKISLVITTTQYIFQIISLVTLRNYYIYIGLVLVAQIVNNIITASVADKMYPEYKPQGMLEEDEIKKINRSIKDLFTSKLGAIILNSADTIVISAFLGLTTLAIYNNYYYIMSSIISFVTVAFTSVTAGIGNSIVTETKEKNYKDLKKFTFLIAWISCFCSTCLLCMYQPFMELWVGKDNMLEFPIVICLCVYYFVYEINMLLNTFKDAAGIWHEDRYRPLITSLCNLTLNIVLIKFMGLYGVVLSTVISILVVGMPWLMHNLFTVLFKRSVREYIIQLIKYGLVTLIVWIASYKVSTLIEINLLLQVVVRLIICTFFSIALFLVVFRKSNEFKSAMELVKNMLRLKRKNG